MNVREAIALAAHVVGAKSASPVPILAYLRVAKGRIVATDTAQQIDIPLPLPALAQEDFCVHAGRFMRLLNALPAESELKLEHRQKRLAISAGATRYELGTLPGEDYPSIAEVREEPVAITVLGKALVAGLKFVASAMATNDVRYYLNGVHFELVAGKLALTATDGRRLHRARVELQDVDLKAKVDGIIAAPSVPRVLELAGRYTDLSIEASATRFNVIDRETLQTKLVDGKFPDTSRVIPADRPSTGGAPRQPLLAAVRRMSQIFAGEKTQGLRLDFRPDHIALNAANSEGDLATERFDWNAADKKFAGIALGLAWEYLADALDALSGDWAFLHLPASPEDSLYITDGEAREVVIMPMRI